MDNDSKNNVIAEQEATVFRELLRSCLDSYMEKGELSDEEWLKLVFQKEIGTITEEKVGLDARTIVDTITTIANNLKSINNAEKNGISKERWMAGQIETSMSNIDNSEQGKQLRQVEEILYQANIEMMDDSSIEENGSKELIEVVGEEKQEYTPMLLKEYAMNIGKNASAIGVQSAAYTLGDIFTKHFFEGQQISPNEMIQEMIRSGANSSLEVITSGALEIASQNELIKALPPETSAEVIASIASMGVENTRILSKILSGEITLMQGIGQYGRVTTAIIRNVWNVAKETSFATRLAQFMPFLGGKAAAIAAVIEASISLLGGTDFGKKIIDTKKKVANAARTIAKTAVQGLRRIGRAVGNGIRNVGKAITRIFS